jgi:hypothetical protein
MVFIYVEKAITAIQDARVTYTIQIHSVLSNAIHLLRENEFVGLFDIVPGLLRTTRSGKPLSSASYSISPFETSTKAITSLRECILEPTFTVHLGEISISIPSKLEQLFLDAVDQNTKLELAKYDTEKPSIVKRKIAVAVHNGRTLLHPPILLPLQLLDGQYTFEASSALNGIVASTCFAIIFELQFDGMFIHEKARFTLN